MTMTVYEHPRAASHEAQARAINAEQWEPLPGMVKLRCAAWLLVCRSSRRGEAVS